MCAPIPRRQSLISTYLQAKTKNRLPASFWQAVNRTHGREKFVIHRYATQARLSREHQRAAGRDADAGEGERQVLRVGNAARSATHG